MAEVSQQLLQALIEFRKVGFRHHAPGHLGRTEFGVLMALQSDGCTNDGVRITDLVKRLESSPPTMTQTTTSLARLGLVERVADTQDRRVVRIRLTDAGRTLIHQRYSEFQGYCSRLASYLGDDDSLKLAELIRKMAQFMQSDPFSTPKESPL